LKELEIVILIIKAKMALQLAISFRDEPNTHPISADQPEPFGRG
jgi:hypothetical protein